MQKTINKINNNYQKEIKNQIELLKTKGYIITPDKEIYKFNIFEKTFNQIPNETFYNNVMDAVKNFWNYSQQENEKIINELLFNPYQTLPIITKKIITEFELYQKANEFLTNEKLHFSKRKLNEKLKENENKKRKNVLINLNEPSTQSQVLINNDIFVNSNYDSKFYKYNPDLKIFELMSNENIRDLFIKNIDKTTLKQSKLAKQYIMDVIRLNDLFYKDNLVKINCEHWNKQREYETNIIEYKASYKTIKSIITSFE